jgi:hypothetical protein
MPRGEDLVREAGRDQPVDGPDRSAEPLVALEHAHLPAALGEQRGTREGVDPAAYEHRVEASHARDSTS